MPDPTIFSIIGNEYYRLTASEKKVADFVQSHRSDVQFMSISELAEACDVADATVSRFCRRMNLKGYSDFRLSIAKAEANAHHAALVHSHDNAKYSDFMQTANEVYNSNLNAMRQSIERLKPDEVQRAVEHLCSARQVFCMGQGGSMLLAAETANIFSTVSGKFFSVADSHLQITRASLFSEGDLLFFFSYSGSTQEMVDIMSVAHNRGAKIILMTRYTKSPGAGLADIVLQCGSDEGPLQMGSMPAKMAQLYIIDLLFHEFCAQSAENTEENRELIIANLSSKHM